MSLSGTLNIGRTGLAVQQAAIQVTGNNIANAGNADYSRQTSLIQTNADQQMSPGIFLAQASISPASRPRSMMLWRAAFVPRPATSSRRMSPASGSRRWSRSSTLGEDSLSSRLGEFFSSWSQLAADPQDRGLRQVGVAPEWPESVASWLQTTRDNLSALQKDAD